MTDLVVLLLVVLWAAVLAPRVVRHFKESSSRTSIEDFHERLHLLERAGPKLVEPAYRLASGDDAMTGVTDVPVGYARPAPLVLVEPVVAPRVVAPDAARAARRPSDSSRRACRRRRDVLLGALATALLTGILGEMHALRLLWIVTAVSVLAIAGYVALVAYARMLAADRAAARPVRPAAPRGGEPASRYGAPRVVHGAARRVGPTLRSTTPVAVRSGGPAAWDEDPPAYVPRHAMGSARVR